MLTRGERGMLPPFKLAIGGLVTLAPCAVKLASELSSACTTMPSQWKPVVDFPPVEA